MSFCVKCGVQVTAGSSFCGRCGAAIEPVPGIVATGSRRPSAESIATEEQRMMTMLRDATLGEYEIIAEIGRGGMAVVYLGHDLALDRKVAIKVMTPALTLMDKGVQERFKREARTAAGLSHPNIIPVFAVKQTESLVYFVMKYVIGRSLESVMEDVGALPIPVAQTILGQVGAALGYAHGRGVVHRDMKPGNVMLDEDGWVVVTDFGIAKVAEAEALTVTGGMVGTPAYMSPEQCAGGDITGLADQYSVGVMAYEMLTGRQPFSSTTLVNLIYDHCHTPPTPLLDIRPDCPPEIAEAVMRMLAKEPAERWPSIEEAVAAVGTGAEGQQEGVRSQLLTLAQSGTAERLLEKFRTPGSPVPRSSVSFKRGTGPKAPSTPRPERVRPSRRWLWPAVAAAALLGGAGWVVLRPGGEPARVEAPPLVTRLDVAPLSMTLAPGERGTFGVVARDSSGQAIPDASVTWGSSAPGVATVSSDGQVLAIAAGTAELIATSGLSSAAAVVTVQQPGVERVATPPVVTSVQVQPAAAALAVGETIRLAPIVRDQQGAPLARRPTSWSSTDTAVVRVSSDGLVTAAGVGTAQIRLDVDGRSGTASVTVTAPPAATPDVDSAQRVQPIVVEPAPPPVTPAPVDPKPEIERVIERYRQAIESRDLERLRAAYPGLTAAQERAWREFFGGVTELRAVLRIQDLAVNDDRATVRIAATYDFRSGRPQTQELDLTATLERGPAGWRLVAIE